MTEPVIDILVDGDFAADVAETFAESISSEFGTRVSAKAVKGGAVISLTFPVIASMPEDRLQVFFDSAIASAAAYQVKISIRTPDGNASQLSGTTAKDMISMATA